MPVEEIESLEQFQKLINGDKPVLIDFWAAWCGPCRMISPNFEGYSGTSEDSPVKFCKVDVDAQPDISQEVGIRAMPTFMLFKGGQKEGEFRGADKDQLKKLVEKANSMVESIPPSDEKSVPPSDETSVPPSDEKSVPPSDETSVPPSDEKSVPPSDEKSVPPSDEKSVPPSDEKSVPPSDEKSVPPSEEQSEPQSETQKK